MLYFIGFKEYICLYFNIFEIETCVIVGGILLLLWVGSFGYIVVIVCLRINLVFTLWLDNCKLLMI